MTRKQKIAGGDKGMESCTKKEEADNVGCLGTAVYILVTLGITIFSLHSCTKWYEDKEKWRTEKETEAREQQIREETRRVGNPSGLIYTGQKQ
jgi:hypothetical protein